MKETRSLTWLTSKNVSHSPWADLLKAKSEVIEWQDEVKEAQSLKNRVGFESLSPEAKAAIDSRISYAMTNLVQYELAFEVIVSQSIALDRSVSKINATLAPAPAPAGPGASTPREIEWMQERIKFAMVRMDDLERKLALQDQLLDRIKVEQAAVNALPRLPSTVSSRSPMEVDDGDGVLDHTPSSLARTSSDLREAGDDLTIRVAEAERTIEGSFNGVLEDPEGEGSSRVTRLKETFQNYRTFIKNAKTALGVTENNSLIIGALRTEAERAIFEWEKLYQEFEAVLGEVMGFRNEEKEVRHRITIRELVSKTDATTSSGRKRSRKRKRRLLLYKRRLKRSMSQFKLSLSNRARSPRCH